MRILYREIKKLLFILLVFAAFCFLFNLLSIAGSGKDPYADYVAGVAEETGVVLGESFQLRLAAFPESSNRTRLQEETAGLPNILDGYNAGGIAEMYIDAGLSGKTAEKMRRKYAALQEVIDTKAAKGEGQSLYFGGSTSLQHQKLFLQIMQPLCVEGLLLSLLATLCVLGYEHVHGTEHLVYATKTGRRLMLTKYAAALITGTGVFILLLILTLTCYFMVNAYGGVWESSLSGGFNIITPLDDTVAGARPFITWHSFTVFTYLLAAIALSAGIMYCFSLAGFIAGISVRNSFIAFFAIILAAAFSIAVTALLPDGSCLRFSLMLTPAALLTKQSLWFTDGGIDVLWPHFETWGVCLSLAVLLLISAAAFKKFSRRDIL